MAVEVLLAEPDHTTVLDDAGDVRDRVEAAVLGDDTVDECIDRGLVADVARGHAVALEHVDAHDRRARAFERVGARGPDAARGTRDDRDPSVDPETIHHAH